MTADPHIAADADLLERFVAGRLSGEELRRVEEHVRACPGCAAAVRAERQIAAGVVRFARQEMKARLARRLRASAPIAIPWQHIAAAAAVALLVIGIGWYSNWFGLPGRGGPSEFGELAERKMEESGTTAATPPPGTSAQEVGQASAVESRMDEVADRTAADRGQSIPGEGGAKREGAEDVVRRNEVAAGGKALAERSTPAPLAAAEKSVATPPLTQQVWATGVVLEEPPALAESDRLGKDKAGETLREEERLQLRTHGTVTRQKRAASPMAPVVLVDQRPFSSLPPAQQMLQLQSVRGEVQMLLDQRGDTLRVLLYLERPLDPRALHSATAQQVGDDSLIIRVEGQAIGLKVPPPLLQARQAR